MPAMRCAPPLPRSAAPSKRAAAAFSGASPMIFRARQQWRLEARMPHTAFYLRHRRAPKDV